MGKWDRVLMMSSTFKLKVLTRSSQQQQHLKLIPLMMNNPSCTQLFRSGKFTSPSRRRREPPSPWEDYIMKTNILSVHQLIDRFQHF